jgi:hypothetical protein
MSLLPGLRRFKAHLKQDGKQLKLLGTLKAGSEAGGPLASGKEMLTALTQ